MKRIMSMGLGLLLLLSLPTIAQDNDATKKELEKLQGLWKLVSVESNEGENQLPDDNPLRNWRVKEKTVTNAKVKLDLNITLLDPTSNPRLIDLTNPKTDQVWEGIYELKDNRWRICLNVNAGTVRQRPVEFAAKGKVGVVLVVLEREENR